VEGLSADDEGRVLISSYEVRGGPRIRLLPDGRRVTVVRAKSLANARSPALLPGCNALSLCFPDGGVRVWDLASGRVFRTASVLASPLSLVAASHRTRTLATVPADGGPVLLWDLRPLLLNRVAFEELTREDFRWVERKVRAEATGAQAPWLRYILAGARRKWAFDVGIGTPRRVIEAGEFDVEIGG
jgi:hypothetical protein